MNSNYSMVMFLLLDHKFHGKFVFLVVNNCCPHDSKFLTLVLICVTDFQDKNSESGISCKKCPSPNTILDIQKYGNDISC
jgi:hypothetical protein